MRDWNDLSGIEKRIAIAKRLGWTGLLHECRTVNGEIKSERLLRPATGTVETGGGGFRYEDVPCWHLDGALAFTSLWDIIQHAKPGACICGAYEIMFPDSSRITGSSWADVISKALYLVVELQNS